MRLQATILLLLPLALASPLVNTERLVAPLHKAGKHIDDHYIVVLKKGFQVADLQAHISTIQASHDVNPLFTFNSEGEVEMGGIKKVYSPTHAGHGYYGYAGAFNKATIDLIRSSPEVDYVEHDQIISVDYIQSDEATVSYPAEPSSSSVQSLTDSPEVIHSLSSPWGLARISHRPALTLGTLQRYDYSKHALDTDKEVDVYVIDTGINVGHVELQGRARWGKTIPKGTSDKDENGHGSHCAGTIASRKYGVAKGANVVAVRVLGANGSGTLSDVIGGIEWAVNDADIQLKSSFAGKRTYKGAVISMSLGGGKSQATDDAVNAAVDAGVTVVVAAGNENKDCDTSSPARAKNVITVGASTLGDERAYFSNFGKGININAPGLNILSIWNTGNTSTNTISGTSMACPHVAGWAAYVMEIYGSETLPIKSQQELNELTILGGGEVSETDNTNAGLSVKSILRSIPIVPQWFTNTLLASSSDAAENVRLTPNQIKGLLTKLATKDILGNLPEGTPNVLLFNNATSSK